MSTSPPRARPIQYNARLGTRWEKEKAAAGKGAFDFPDDPTTVGPWVIGECVGKGASGRVKVARHSITGQLAAVKILPLEAVVPSIASLATRKAKTEKHRNGIDKEIVMMKLMDHPNIVRIFDVFEGASELFLILEYVDGGELFDFLVNHGRMDPVAGLAYFKQIVYGLSYAHAFSIIHRDLKPENILIHSLHPPRIKIADWGMAAFAPPSAQLATSCGSPHYASPEIVNGMRYDGTATDIWSCGVILYALMTGRLPFDDKNVKTLLCKVKSGKYEIPNYVHAEAADLIRRMLVVDVDKRIKMADILAHPFLQHDTPGITYVPAPSVVELARPLRSTAHIKPDLIRSLAVICDPIAQSQCEYSEGDYADMEVALLSPPGEGSLVKALYFLLLKHRERSLENFGGRNINQGEFNIKHYPAPPVKDKGRLMTSGEFVSPKTSALSSGHAVRTMITPLQTFIPLSPAPNGFEPTSPGAPTSPRQGPASPLGPRSPHTPSASRERPRPKSTADAGKHPFTAPLHLGGKHAVGRKAQKQRARDTIDGLPPSVIPRCDEEVEFGFVSVSLPEAAPSPLAAAAPLASPPAQRVATVPWPRIEPPRVGDPALQRKIDDIAGRFKVYVEQHAAQGGPASPRPGSDKCANVDGPGSAAPRAPMSPRTPVQPARGDARERRRTHAGGLTNKLSSPADWDANKENKRQDGASPASPAIGSGGKEAKRGNRKSRPPPLDLHNGRRATLMGFSIQSPTASPEPPVAPVLLAAPAVVGEFKGWFSNLFNWKAQHYVLHSVDNCRTTREEVAQLLEQFGVLVTLEDAHGGGTLRCKVEEAYDPVTGSVIQKSVRFRVEIAPVLGYIHQGTPNAAPPSVVHPHDAQTADAVQGFQSTIMLMQEKGALSTFRNVYHRLRAEWRLDALRSPSHVSAGGATPMMGAGPLARLSR